MLLGVVSAKGAPGVTSAAVALTAVCGGVMVELDPSGGSVDCWLSSTGEPGLLRVASAMRRHTDPTGLVTDATEILPGVRVLRAPSSGVLAESTIVALADRLLPCLAELDETVIVDGGRWARSQPTARRLAGCDAVALLCSPTVEGIEAARWQVDHLRRHVDRVAFVTVGDRPYGPSEVADATNTSVAGALAWDRRGLARLLDRGASPAWRRTPLARSALQVLQALGFEHQATPAIPPNDAGEEVAAAPEAARA